MAIGYASRTLFPVSMCMVCRMWEGERGSQTRMSTRCLFLRSPDSFSWAFVPDKVLYTAAMASSGWLFVDVRGGRKVDGEVGREF